ncbi:MAG TPA: hypothetical protein VMM38_15165 [Aridibacter sp.]|nr:hypothetical protein [Aridibacter sp.]
MNDEIKKLPIAWKIASVFLAALGTFIQAGILGDMLIRRLDFMLAPEAEVLKAVAFKGLLTAPLIAILVSWLVLKKSTRWGPAVAGIVCPLVISAFYVVAVSWAGFDWPEQIEFGGITRFGLFREFFRDALLLSALGGGIGLIIGSTIDKIVAIRTKKS